MSVTGGDVTGVAVTGVIGLPVAGVTGVGVTETVVFNVGKGVECVGTHILL